MVGRPRSAYRRSQVATLSSMARRETPIGVIEFARRVYPSAKRRRQPSKSESCSAGHARKAASSMRSARSAAIITEFDSDERIVEYLAQSPGAGNDVVVIVEPTLLAPQLAGHGLQDTRG